MGELYRNICLAFACIFVTTLLLLSNFLASVQVLLAVLFTLVNVGGSMYFWGEEGKRYLIVEFLGGGGGWGLTSYFGTY